MYLFFVKFSNVYEHKLTSENIFIRLLILYYIICTCKNTGYVMMCALTDCVWLCSKWHTCLLPSTRCILPTIFLRIVCGNVYNKQQMFQSSMLNFHMTNINMNSAQLSRLLPYKQMC